MHAIDAALADLTGSRSVSDAAIQNVDARIQELEHVVARGRSQSDEGMKKVDARSMEKSMALMKKLKKKVVVKKMEQLIY